MKSAHSHLRCCVVLATICLGHLAAGQTVDHWETVVYDNMTWRYFPGMTTPGSTWMETGFDDSGWPQGSGGFGYGDDDDGTAIDPVLSVYLRISLTVTDKRLISQALLNMDYDDGFIAYLNGVEIARANMAPGPSAFDQPAAGLHEATLYQGIAPDNFLLDEASTSALLADGDNVLAIEVHNADITSSDLSSSAFLSLGITTATTAGYGALPSWFSPPTAFTSSNLPIIVIDTDGQSIPDEPKITATMGIINNGAGIRNEITDPFTDYNGFIGIELRGESSQDIFPKKSFTVETRDELGENNNVSLLGMPKENDWVLYALYSDKSLMRTELAFGLGRALGQYAPRTAFVEVVINGEYLGLYELLEKIKQDDARVDIAKLKPEDNSGDELTGGYILRVDKEDEDGYPSWTPQPSPMLSGENPVTLQYFDPPGEELTQTQRDYIYNYIEDFESAMSSSQFAGTEGYRKYADVASFVDHMILTEITKNIDGYVFSTYMYKDKDSNNDKLHMGPLWDFDLAFGNLDYWENAQYAPGWMWDDQYRMFWFRRLVEDPYFTRRLKCRWLDLRGSLLTNDYFLSRIDSIANALEESRVRNFERWNILGVYVWPNQFVGSTYDQEVDFLKQWILDRLEWMDENLPGACDVTTGIEDNNERARLAVYPNPFSSTLYFETASGSGPYYWALLNSLGQVVHEGVADNALTAWDGTDDRGGAVARGIYVLRIVDEHGRIRFERVVRE